MLKIVEKRVEGPKVYFSAHIQKELDFGINLNDIIFKIIETQRKSGYEPSNHYGPLEVKIHGGLVYWNCFKEDKNKAMNLSLQ